MNVVVGTGCIVAIVVGKGSIVVGIVMVGGRLCVGKRGVLESEEESRWT